MRHVGNGEMSKYDLDSMLEGHCGRKIRPTAREEVFKRVGEAETLTAIADKLGAARNAWDITATEYGTALALVLADQI